MTKAERILRELQALLSRHRDDLRRCQAGDKTFNLGACERAVKIDIAQIRKHCADYDIHIPNDIPDVDE